MADIHHAIKVFAEMADDFLFDILILKTKDITNGSLPFLHAHTLELSAKTACYKLGIDIKKSGHDIMSIYKLLEPSIPQIRTLIPTSQDLVDYKKFWLPSDAPQNAYFPDPKDIDRIECAYFVDNVMNLKYGFTKELVQVSTLEISYHDINQAFLGIFNACRQVYVTPDLNERIKDKIFSVYGNTQDTHNRLKSLLGI